MRVVEGKLNKLILYIGFVFAVIALPLMSSNSANALNVVQQNLVVKSHSPTLTVYDDGTNTSPISPRLEFNKLNDYITYKLTIRNLDNKKYQITDIVDNNTNDAIELSYVYPTDLNLDDKEIEFTIKYIKVATTPLSTINITIKFIEESGNTGQINVPVNPNTGANTISSADFVTTKSAIIIYSIFAGIMAVIYIIIKRKGNKAKYAKTIKIVAIAILALGLIPVAVIATISKDLQIKFDFTNVKLNPPYTTYTVKFDGNGGSGNMGDQTIDVGVATKLDSIAFTAPTGQVFKEWNIDKNGGSDSYSNEQEVTDLTSAGGSITLYAIWYTPAVTLSEAYAAAGKTKHNGYYKMQDMTSDICDATTAIDEPGQTQVIDARDNKVYWVTKLKDGRCWMTQNLDHDISTSFAYTPDNTDIPANWVPDKPTYTTTNATAWANGIPGYGIQQSYDPGDKIWDGNPSSSMSITISNMTQGTNQHYHFGNYYNWGAAVAMNNTSAYTTQNQDVNQSICPKGWTLPKSGNNTSVGSFQYLVNQYGWANDSMTNPNMWDSPLYFPLAGYWYGSSAYVAYYGSFWSLMINSSSNAYSMDGIYSGAVYTAHHNNRRNGFSVRCVAREAGSTPGTPGPTNLADMTTMQEMTPELCASTTVGTTATLKDTRDNSTYSVAKLADNKCWMTQNMRLDFSKLAENISADNTNNPSSTFIATANAKPSANNGTWCTDSSSACDDQLQYNTVNIGDSTYDNYGVYYNWYTATAGNGTYSTSSGNTTGDICPKGWRLPTGGDTINTDFKALNDAINFGATNNPSGLMAAPANFLYSGFGTSSVSNRGSFGYYWSSTAYSSSNAYSLAFGSTIVYPGTTFGTKYNGFSVRCVADEQLSLYNTVASMTKGTLAENNVNLSDAIIEQNSGVYTYDPAVYGEASDAANTHQIYFYRGILDSTSGLGSYGSDGQADNYPNYVKLGNTCWRIVRTTGSGGVKMIYNGLYGATTAGSCANSQTAAQLPNATAFNSDSASNGFTSVQYQNIHAVGYTYNSAVNNSTTATAASTVFGSNSNPSLNNSDSIIKQYIEQWYSNNMTTYTDKLEPSAGFCNDRTFNTATSWATPLTESTTIIPYGTSSMTEYYFGAYPRNIRSGGKPTLNCARNVVDLYTTNTATNGNKQLAYPTALLTADELFLAGSGYGGSNIPAYHANSFVRSGSDFWLFSPINRLSNGNARGFYLGSSGNLSGYSVYYTYGARPAISLAPGTGYTSGDGTATNPWVVE